MFTRRIAMAALCGALMSALTITPVAAAGPKAPGGEAPLTAEQRAASDRKVAAAKAYLAGVAASGVDLVSLQCVTPTSATHGPVNAGMRDPAGVPPGRGARPGERLLLRAGGRAGDQRITPGPSRPGAQQVHPGEDRGLDGDRRQRRDELSEPRQRARDGDRERPRRPAVWQWVVAPLGDSDRDGTPATSSRASCGRISAARRCRWRSR